jgi:hypothetical protein
MPDFSLTTPRSLIQDARLHGTLAWLGILLGWVMPLVSAAVYPTYVHQMPYRWLEWTRLLELPFVACEMVVLHIALKRGFRDRDVWQPLPRDVKIAAGLLLIGLTVSSVFVSKSPAASVSISIFTVVHVRFAAAVYYLTRRDRLAGVHTFVPLLALGLIGLLLVTAWRFSFPPPLKDVPGGTIEWPSALPGFISVRHFGTWTSAAAAGLLASLLYAEKRDPRIEALYVLTVWATAWSGTRAGLLAIALVGAVMVLSLRRLPKFDAMLVIGSLTIVAVVFGMLTAPTDKGFWLYHPSVPGDESIAGGDGRMELWTATLNKWAQAPLFGWGSGSTFWEVHALNWSHTQPHNVVLQFLVSWGVVGAAGALWLIGRAIAAVHRPGTANPDLRPIVGVLYALLLQSLLEGMLHYPRFIMVIMIGFAVILAQRSLDREAAVRG